jgi:hypothetical protein
MCLLDGKGLRCVRRPGPGNLTTRRGREEVCMSKQLTDAIVGMGEAEALRLVRDEGTTMIFIEQNVEHGLSLAAAPHKEEQ